MTDQKRMKESQQCEKESGLAQTAVKELQAGSVAKAEAAIEGLFTKCAKIDEACAKEMAPDLILKMRLSGLGMSEQCMAKGKSLQGKKPSEEERKCQEQNFQKMVNDLNKHDIKAA